MSRLGYQNEIESTIQDLDIPSSCGTFMFVVYDTGECYQVKCRIVLDKTIQEASNTNQVLLSLWRTLINIYRMAGFTSEFLSNACLFEPPIERLPGNDNYRR